VSFPSNFRWGAATSAYQIEGATRTDGRGFCVWDMMCRRRGKIWQDQNADKACAHYQRAEEDVALIKQLGLNAYRFSLSWPRILPAGTGKTNEAGLAFYDRLIDLLLAADIEPWITLFHWDYPYELYCRGGWLNPDSPRWFADYARIVIDRYSDRVSHWMTHNEPQCFIGLGLHTGEHAPGDKLGLAEVLRAGHHALLGHGLAAQVIRERAKKTPLVGWAHTGDIPMPATNSSDDLSAARESWARTRPDTVWNHSWWSDPVFLGSYPDEGLRVHGSAAPAFTAEEMRQIHQPGDFFGSNNYRAYTVRRAPDGGIERVREAEGAALTHMDWGVHDDLLYWAARWPHERYKKPIVITENGLAGLDWVGLDGRVRDGARIDYLRRQLLGLRRAVVEEIPVMGYFQWSLLDNFEWSHGYRYRFGLVHVDYATQRRTPKDSFRWYRQVIGTNGAQLDLNPP